MKKAVLCLFLLVALLSLRAVFHVAGYYPGTGQTGEIAINGNIGYLAAGNRGLRVLDLSDPIHPVPISSDSTGYPITRVKLHGDYVYAFGSTGVLQVFQLSQPTDPVLISSTYFPTNVRSFICEGNRLYMCLNYYYDEGSHCVIKIVDISNPYEPIELHQYTQSATIGGFWVEGSLLYLADDSGFTILDASNPLNPQVVSNYPITYGASCVVVNDSMAYVGASNLHIFDISNPSAPMLLSQVEQAWMETVALHDNTLYGMISGLGMRSINISDPMNPFIEGYFFVLGTTKLELNDQYAYISHSQRGMLIVDITEPADVTLVGTIQTDGVIGAIIVEDGIAYLADHSSGLKVYNVSDPTNPLPLGSLNIGRQLNDIVKVNDMLYLGSGRPGSSGGLEIVDVADPTNPILLGHYTAQDETSELAIRDNIAYITDNYYGLKIINVADPTNPILMGSINPNGYEEAIALYGNIAVIMGSYGLTLIDISNPYDPEYHSEIGFYNPNSMALAGSIVYVSVSSSILMIDISDTDNPTLIGYLTPNVTNSFNHCQVIGDRLYTADYYWHEILVYDISIPHSPQLCKRYPSNNNIGYMFMYEGLLYAANREISGIGIHNLSVLPIDDPIVPETGDISIDNYPNPFNPTTTLRFNLLDAQPVDLDIFNLRGQKVCTIWSGNLPQGIHTFKWEGTNEQGKGIASGVYIYRLSTPGKVTTKRMVLAK